MSNVMNTPAEVVEAEYPIRVECQRLRGGSGGAGRRRGGDGLHREYRVLCDDMTVTSMFERRVVPPYGLQGGAPGAPFRVTVDHADGRRTDLPGKANVRLVRGDAVVVESCGGGGYGPPEGTDGPVDSPGGSPGDSPVDSPVDSPGDSPVHSSVDSTGDPAGSSAAVT